MLPPGEQYNWKHHIQMAYVDPEVVCLKFIYKNSTNDTTAITSQFMETNLVGGDIELPSYHLGIDHYFTSRLMVDE